MAQTQNDLLQALLDTARTLPAEKLAEVLDFAGYLRPTLHTSNPARLKHYSLMREPSGWNRANWIG